MAATQRACAQWDERMFLGEREKKGLCLVRLRLYHLGLGKD